MENWTSIDQCRHLVQVGLNPATADMWYWKNGDHYILVPNKPIAEELNGKKLIWLPCWSVGQLIRLLPNKIYGPRPSDHPTDLAINNNYIVYMDFTGMQDGPSFKGDLLDCCYKMICWLGENNYILEGGEIMYKCHGNKN